ncbi:S-DNA-T family DNA segregation ATPase FtsK/SpoIIIE [Caulobacter ginsengisoli]|uniref:DNA translocase FtsK n=1 Tax=Caulobacter ginsengisoli TaxID=400775 RepID=A0ABU0IVC3_9CAUL|nr:DNA translocase FtsK 4TM domain-containing protein [Caulobacter ginsengisoli]MDQ0465330.1 S-DNA-T family DNA segregation ATPase FtsK/SpoIIIE [Caulobacter ginsengisoli]
MARVARRSGAELLAEAAVLAWRAPTTARFRGGLTVALGVGLALSVATYNAADPSFNAATAKAATNALAGPGALLADLMVQSLGLSAWIAAALLVVFGLSRVVDTDPDRHRGALRRRAVTGFAALLLLAGGLAIAPKPAAWPLAKGLGGFWGQALLDGLTRLFAFAHLPAAGIIAAVTLLIAGIATLGWAVGFRRSDLDNLAGSLAERMTRRPPPKAAEPARRVRRPAPQRDGSVIPRDVEFEAPPAAPLAIKAPKPVARAASSDRELRERQKSFEFVEPGGFRLPELAMLAKPKPRQSAFDEEALRQNARLLESVLSEFGVRGVIDQIRPGPVVTLYELAPAPGVKHARVVALSDDIARSMSVAACRVAVVQGRNAIGIELPNAKRETVYLRDLLAAPDYERASQLLPLALGETIGGEPYIADLTKMPHLLVAGTTGSGKSVGINAMILSILYRLSPSECRFIMIDPKMLELSVYDGIPHLLAPVVTDPKKAIVALKWTVREMEDRYRRMSKIGVRNVAGYNEKAREALAKGEHFERTVQTGFDDAGRAIYESEKIRPEPMPYLVVVMDEMADLMLVAGKEVEGAVQRLAQMARAAGIHLIMATQRPSVDVITGTIKANFPTRISFQVTSKIDSRTILGEQGGEQLLGQGDMLYMAGGGRITRLHGPFVSDGEVEAVAKFLRDQGEPQYLEEVTAGGDDEDGEGSGGGYGGEGEAGDLYDQAVAIVTRDRKASTSYVQRRLQIGYNRAASLIERMEREGVVTAANHAGKRDILAPPPP